MAKGVAIDWPDDDVLLALAVHGSVNKAAAAIDLGAPTLRNRLVRRGVLEEFNRRCKQPLATPAAPIGDEPVSRVEILEQENAELRRALHKARSEDVKFERVIDAINTYLPVTNPTYKPRNITRGIGRDPHTLVLLWSDQHAAETVSLEQTNGLNEYSWEIMMRRHDELRRGIASWAERFAPIERLVVLALGDGLSGNIHEELAETNEMPFAEATVQWGVDGAAWLRTLPDVIPWHKKADVLLAAVPGNHPRAHKRPRAKGKHDNGDWVSSQVMRQALSREDWITFEIPRAARHLVDVYGRTILAMHGDAVPTSSMVGVPWGGVIRLDAKLRNQFAYDHLAIGHWHEANLIGNRRIWVNGTVKGDDEYGIERFGGGATPTQLLIPFHRQRGMVGAQYIDLDEPVSRAASRSAVAAA